MLLDPGRESQTAKARPAVLPYLIIVQFAGGVALLLGKTVVSTDGSVAFTGFPLLLAACDSSEF